MDSPVKHITLLLTVAGAMLPAMSSLAGDECRALGRQYQDVSAQIRTATRRPSSGEHEVRALQKEKTRIESLAKKIHCALPRS